MYKSALAFSWSKCGSGRNVLLVRTFIDWSIHGDAIKQEKRSIEGTAIEDFVVEIQSGKRIKQIIGYTPDDEGGSAPVI